MPVTHLQLDVTTDPCVLPRVVAVTRRRGEIVSLSYSTADQHRPGRIDLSVRTRHEALLRGRLLGLVSVSAVR
jgi:acetolactate synthase regulatory subunit